MERCSLRPQLRSSWICFALGFLALSAAPVGAGVFTVDGNGNGTNEADGSDDITFSFNGSMGLASGRIRSIDLAAETPFDLQMQVDDFVDFIGGTEFDFGTMDVLIFDVMLDVGSAPVDEIGVAVGVEPIIDPDAGGYLEGGQSPDAIALSPGTSFFPGAVFFSFDKNSLSSVNLEAGEMSVRMFVLWDGGGPQTGQTAVFSVSSGTNADFQSLLTDTVAGKKKGGKGKGGGDKGGGKGGGKKSRDEPV